MMFLPKLKYWLKSVVRREGERERFPSRELSILVCVFCRNYMSNFVFSSSYVKTTRNA